MRPMAKYVAGLMAAPAALVGGASQARTLDHVSLATEAAGAQHAIRITNGSVAPGGLGQPALRIAPPSGGGWKGGGVAFRVRVDPARPTFFTARLWGGEVVEGNLTLICDGKQVGDRLLSDYDQLDYGAKHQQFPGAFFYRTYRLPDAVTHGKTTIDCMIEASGPIFSYADAFAKFQRPMEAPSRGIYDVYTHDDPWLDTAGAVDGAVIVPQRRPGAGRIVPGAPGAEVLGRIRTRIEAAVQGLLVSPRPLGQPEIAFLAHFRSKTWSKLAKDPRVLAAIVKGMDDFAAAYAANPDLVKFEKSTWNPDWFGFGMIGDALASDPAAFAPLLDQQIAWKPGTTIARREALATMLEASRDWLRTHRRFYTNQSMIVDCWGIYLANRGLAVVAPAKAMPEAQARRYLYEATGIEPWRGDDLPGGGSTYDAGGPDGTKAQAYRVAKGYHLVTHKGLTRELGYVGNYGEVGDWVSAIYTATRPGPGQPGDARIREQLAKIVAARGFFRYPAADDQGFATMRNMADIGWRDLKAPGEIAYVQEAHAGVSSAIQAAILTGDPRLVGYAQQMVADNQLWPMLEAAVGVPGFRQTNGLLDIIDDVTTLAGMPAQPARLPMTAGQPDFAFADPEDGVVAIKRGDERFYASVWWRANRGISQLGRVWMSGPRGNHIATVPVRTGFTPSGQFWVRPNKVVLLKSGSFNADYGLDLAEAGERLPLAQPPAGIVLTPGEDSIYAGRGENHVMAFAGYTIAVNASETKTFDFTVPPHAGSELVSGKQITAGTVLTMAPLSTVVFFDPDFRPVP
ncbi:hypothetical protein [Novosphingobium sp. SG720]|uniref:hypothetical protein n=1 Tax=Novosphingobium sp. SG720 TaxID=2586998 RepID=UPI00144610E4|nr:hypothetical protein [Novosphingobium sp. SG720]